MTSGLGDSKVPHTGLRHLEATDRLVSVSSNGPGPEVRYALHMSLKPTFLRPSAILAPYVSDYFAIEADPPPPGGGASTARVLPVPHTQLVFGHGDPCFERLLAGSLAPSPDYAITGFMSQTIEYSCPGRLGVIMVGLQPWGLRPFLRGAIPEMVDRNLLISTEFLHVANLEWQVRSAGSLQQRIDHIETFLLRYLRQPALDQPIVEAVEELVQRRGDVDLGQLARDAGIGSRHFRRRFQAAIGVAPRRFCQVVRFQSVFTALDRQEGAPDWCALALEAGYYDQSHFIHAFRAFTGLTPAAYLSRMQRTDTGRAFDAEREHGDPALRTYV